jgi:hypothetical protein
MLSQKLPGLISNGRKFPGQAIRPLSFRYRLRNELLHRRADCKSSKRQLRLPPPCAELPALTLQIVEPLFTQDQSDGVCASQT